MAWVRTSKIQLLRSSIVDWDAAVISPLVKTPIRDFINLTPCLTTRFLRCTPLEALQMNRSAMWR